MAKELYVSGYYDAEFLIPDTQEEVSEEVEQEIFDKLQSGEYLFSMFPPRVIALTDLHTTLYDVILDATDALIYSWVGMKNKIK
jgi:hypothetical protein